MTVHGPCPGIFGLVYIVRVLPGIEFWNNSFFLSYLVVFENQSVKLSGMISRRSILNKSFFLLGVPFIKSGSFGKSSAVDKQINSTHYPNIEPEIVNEVVGKSHFDLDRVRQLVDHRPELAKASWEWRYGDWESAIGAASHVGRRDIVRYLISKGARPTLYTHAMMGALDIVKSYVTFYPGIQRVTGPHGISLLDHAEIGLMRKDDLTVDEIKRQEAMLDYLVALGDAGGPEYLPIEDDEKERMLGDYYYGENEDEGFSVTLNMRKMPSLGPIGGFGGGLLKIAENTYTYNGAPSVQVTFEVDGNVAKSITVKDPDYTIVAFRK